MLGIFVFLDKRFTPWQGFISTKIGPVPTVYIFFNNDTEGFAPANAACLINLLKADIDSHV